MLSLPVASVAARRWAPVALALFATAAIAQDRAAPVSPISEDDVDEIIVTGSRIVRDELTAQSPIAVINADNIAIQNPLNIEEVLRRSPQFAAAIGSQVNNGNEGAATVDLRNLGEERTLVLVNGKRFVPFDPDNAVDVNMIPTSLIQRVEVVTGGASATYGSDAVAGVVNFILKEDFEGIEVNSLYNITQEGDGETYGFDITTGGNFAEGRGNLVFNVGYTKQGSVSQADRRFSEFALNDDLTEFGSFNAEEATTFYSPFANDPFDGCIQFTPDSDLQGCVDSFNFNPFNLFQVPQQRWTATALGRFEITENVEFFTRGSFANNKTRTIIAPTPTGFPTFRLNTDNPFLSQAARDQLDLIDQNECDEPVFDETDPDNPILTGCDQLSATAGDGYIFGDIGKRFTELGTRDSRFENNAFQVVGGLRGNFAETQRWEAFAQYGRVSRNQRFSGDISNSRLKQAILVDLGGEGGTARCFDAVPDPNDPDQLIRIPVPGCVPANIFGAGTLSGAGADYTRIAIQEINNIDQFVAGGSLTGETPLSFPTAGDAAVSYAAGVEYRKEQGESTPDAAYASADALGFGGSAAVEAEIDIREVFGEVLVPLVRDLPGAQAVNFEAGIRFANYKNRSGGQGNSFDNTSFKVGADWSPVDSLRFRGMFQRAVRAPNLGDVGEARAFGTGSLNFDPCEGTNPVGDATLTQLCIDNGVPPGRIGSVTSIIAGQVGLFTSGNINLQPEEADTITVGFVYQSELIPGFTASVDYYNIEIDDGIVEPLEQNIVDACFNVEQDASAPFCQRLLRSTSSGGLNGGPTVGIDATRLNAGFETAEGIDFAIGYGFSTDAGDWNFNLAATYMIEQIIQDASFLPRNDCAGLTGTICLRPYNEWNAVLNSRFSTGPLTVQVDTRLVTGVRQDAIDLGGADPGLYGNPEIGTYVYWDLRGQYDINDTWTVRAGIENVLDREPPIVGAFYGGTAENSGNTYPSVYDALGRAFTFGVTARF